MLFSKPRRRSSVMPKNAAKPATMPNAMPPKKSTRNVTPASAAENAPVTAAAMANWKHTTPDASLMSDSPESRIFWRLVSETVEPSAPTAAASVGPSAAAQANAAASGIEGTIQCRANPTTSTVMITSPMASERIEGRLFHSSRLLDSRASLKSSGAMNRTKKSSESMWTSATCGTTSAAARPTTIWTSGSDTRRTTRSATAAMMTQASSTKTSSNDSMDGLSGGGLSTKS